MNDGLPKALQELIEYCARFPGIGKKTATRMAFFLLQKTPEYHQSFANVLSSIASNTQKCSSCFHLCDAESNMCGICTSAKRDHSQVCVVESSLDLLAMERSGCFSGVYFVLGGVISPMDGIGPEDIRIEELRAYLAQKNPSEVIIALSSTMEGEATASYLAHVLAGFSCTLSRIARGMPLGTVLQHTDENTLHRAFAGRNPIEKK